VSKDAEFHASQLAADVCTTIKQRGQRFESDERLADWLDEDGISYSYDELAAALRQLERISRLRRPHQDQWRTDLPLPGYREPRVFRPRVVAPGQVHHELHA
jgi:hypothetical protein